MSRGSAKLTAARKEEIISACEKLYQTMSFREITMREIGNATSFSRPSIYNYFQAKEEIFLALLQREYEAWVSDLDSLLSGHDTLSADQFADALARSLEKRKLMLKILSMNHFDMEANSREERLTEFKAAYGNTLKSVRRCLDKFCSWMSEEQKNNFIYIFFPFIYGIYPYTYVTEKQRTAMERSNAGFQYFSVYELTYSCLRTLLEQEKR